MEYISTALAAVEEATQQEIQDWIIKRTGGLHTTPLDNIYTRSKGIDTPRILENIYQAADQKTKKKIKDSLLTLLKNSLIELSKIEVLSVVIFTLGRLDLSFPYISVFIFLERSKGPELVEIKSELVALLQGRINQSNQIKRKFESWFWQDPVPIGDEHFFQIFAGLVSNNRQKLVELIIRLYQINSRLPANDRIHINLLRYVLIENCKTRDFKRAINSNQFKNLQQEVRELIISLTK